MRVILTLVILLLTTVTGITQEVDFTRDRIEIAEQLAQYSYRWDGKNAKGFSELFAGEAVMERWRDGALVSGSRIVGRQAIFEYAKRSHAGRLADRQTRHHMSNLVFLELSEERALTENMALITHQTAESGTPFINGSGIYRNTWRKTEHGWRIVKRILFSDRVIAR